MGSARVAKAASSGSRKTGPLLAELLLEALPLPAALLNHKGLIVRTNATWRNTSAARACPLDCQDDCLSFFSQLGRAGGTGSIGELLCEVMLGLRSSIDIVHELQAPGARLSSFRLRASRIQLKHKSFVLLIHEDVTEALDSAARERTSSDWLQLALEAGRLGAWEWDRRTGHITWTTPSNAIFHIPDGAFDGRYWSFLKLVHPDDRRRVRIAVVRSRRERRTYQCEYRLADTREGEVWVRATGRFLFNRGGRAPRMLGVVQDITATRKRAQLKSERERKQALATLTAAVAHEFNGLLLAAASFLDTAVYNNEACIGPNLRQARNAITRSQSLSAALLEAYMGEGVPHRPLPLSEWLPQSLARLQGELGAAVKIGHRFEARGVRAAVSGAVLEHVLRILVNNARDAGANAIEVAVSRGETNERGLQPVHLGVADNGGGIDPDLQQRVFQRYFSTRTTRARAGLGLTLADELLRAAAGSVALLGSRAGLTQFRITLLPGVELTP